MLLSIRERLTLGANKIFLNISLLCSKQQAQEKSNCMHFFLGDSKISDQFSTYLILVKNSRIIYKIKILCLM
jgi:hypothetical protein